MNMTENNILSASTRELLASPLAPAAARSLAQVGFIGAFSGRTAEAEIIFQSLRRLYPHNCYVVLGLAVVWMTARKFVDALALLERIKPSNSEEVALVQVCFAWALQGQGRHTVAYKMLQEVVTLNSHAHTTQFARALLANVH
jgi:hypothetical protein